MILRTNSAKGSNNFPFKSNLCLALGSQNTLRSFYWCMAKSAQIPSPPIVGYPQRDLFSLEFTRRSSCPLICLLPFYLQPRSYIAIFGHIVSYLSSVALQMKSSSPARTPQFELRNSLCASPPFVSLLLFSFDLISWAFRKHNG